MLRDTFDHRKSFGVRRAVTPPASYLPTTIIAKCPLAPSDDPFAARVSFINEWAALTFLDQIAPELAVRTTLLWWR